MPVLPEVDEIGGSDLRYINQSRSKKWRSIIILVLIISFTILGVALLKMKNPSITRQCEIEGYTKAIDPIAGTVTSLSHASYVEECIMRKVVEKEDLRACGQSSDPWLCQGLVSKNIAWCNNKYLGDSTTDRVSRDRCLTGVGMSTNDLAPCFPTDGQPNRFCVDRTAHHNQNYTMCFERPITTNETLNKEIVDNCLSPIIWDSNITDKELCLHITHPSRRNSCFDKLARRTKDSSLCRQIVASDTVDEYTKWECTSNVAETLQDMTVCLEIPEEHVSFISCIQKLAKIKQDETICNYLQEKNYNEIPYCIMSVAIHTKNPSICNHISLEKWPDKTICSTTSAGYQCKNGGEVREECKQIIPA